MQNYQMTIAKVQQDSMWWHHEIVLRLYRPSQADYVYGIHKVNFKKSTSICNAHFEIVL